MAGKSATVNQPLCSQKFNVLADKIRQNRGVRAFSGRLLSLDPGEMTGWTVWDCIPGEDDVRIAHGQLACWPMSDFVPNFTWLLDTYQPTQVVYESYHIYDWKLDTHSFSDVPTLRIIGGMETCLIQRSISYTYQTAQVAKGFVTDDRLKQFGYWETGLKHSRDAHRHAIYYLCFGETVKK
jgi:hypothetical protein